MDPLQPQHCAEMLSALAAPERLRIIRILTEGPHNVTEIADRLQDSIANVSHHLNVLHDAGLLQRQKQGRFVLYSMAPGVLPADGGSTPAHLDLGCCRLEIPPIPKGP
jgi:DNA-binding transcriptional ArsR family regulator